MHYLVLLLNFPLSIAYAYENWVTIGITKSAIPLGVITEHSRWFRVDFTEKLSISTKRDH